ncbi:MAG TPA: LPS assembly protein LptD [Pyrinomonadaceae bacterium]|nr:LPS assembly protein LptD [Pyrinomonadaceae bacterium]
MHWPKVFIAVLLTVPLFVDGNGQVPNPVDRQVANPITDTPNINPVAPEQSIKPPSTRREQDEKAIADGELVVYSGSQSVEGVAGSRILTYTGNVDARYGNFRMQADKIIIYEADNRMIAVGSVVFDEGDDQRITGARGEFNLKTRLGRFEDSTGFTNQTNDGTIIYFIAEKVERTAADTVVVTKGKFTSCEEAVPKWSFTADEATIKVNDKVKLKNGKFRIKDIPVVPFPYVSIPIRQQDRASGFLTPAFGFSGNKGLRISTAYFQTLGRSADVTIRGDIYSSRGIGYGFDVRTRTNDRSFFDFGLYAVKDRIFGAKKGPDRPDQGGSVFYAQGVQYFSNGWTAGADVRVTSNLAFRQVFSDGIQQIISPIEVSQGFGNKSWGNYTLNLLARTQVISIPNVTVNTKNLPSVHFEKRPSRLSFMKGVYFSFKTGVEGVSRRENVADLALYQSQTGGAEPVRTPLFGLRYDAYPQVSIPISTKYVNFTATASLRMTYYSSSFNDMRRVVEKDVMRRYGEFEFDVRPVALAKNFYGKGNAFRFRHVIEPFATYRFIKGINDFNRIIRIDQLDTITDTNEVEFGIANRIYTRRYAEAVTDDARRRLSSVRAANGTTLASLALNDDDPRQERTDAVSSVASILAGSAKQKNDLSIQPYEIFSLVIRGKYFFDKTFGGALVPGQRNQIAPITSLSFYTFGGVARRFSPISVDMTYRPQRTIFFNTRMDVGIKGEGLRAVSATVGYDTPLIKVFQSFYYTRAVDLVPSLAAQLTPPPDPRSSPIKEPGTLRGSQWSPSIFIGDRDNGLYGGASVFFDFENRRAARLSPLISTLYTVGYAFDCCALALQWYSLNVGVRNENRLMFSFRLNGIGAFGTQQIGQGLR